MFIYPEIFGHPKTPLMVKNRNILVLTYWSYAEALIQSYTLPYVRIMKRQLGENSIIYLFTLEKEWMAISGEERSRIEKDLMSEGIIWMSIRYSPFGIKALFKWSYNLVYLALLIFRKSIQAIHCWATPAGAVGYILSVFTGRKLILDSYEPHAEAMLENGTWTKTSLPFRLLFWLEKKQTKRASFVISATHGMNDYARKKYGVSIKKFCVKPACVDLTLFSEKNLKNEKLQDTLGLQEKIVCVYAGKLGGIYLEEEVFDFVKVAAGHWGEAFRFLLLSPHNRGLVDNLCAKSGVEPSQVILKFVPHSEIPNYIGLADFAITPVKPVPSKK